ncbi:UDP-N-acetylglucosamine 1-carboxyvinyltransferase [Patescibacteria group bacterium]|nr:UDP-N-acetylglucosamine 1-carboxyvinyltransferase [Patescibacteria group bacterium]
MSKFIIEGGHSLRGEVTVSGSKNATLPILASTLLTAETCTIENVPNIQDIQTLLSILESLGSKISWSKEGHLVVDNSNVSGKDPDFSLVRKIRASVLISGPLLARFGRVKVTHPGGCHIGARPIDVHLRALSALGAKVTMEDQFYSIDAPAVIGAKVVLDEMSVTATENVIMAAVLARGITEIHLAAAEPEITNLIESLNLMGAKIRGMGLHVLVIEGVDKLHGAHLQIIPDRIEAGTLVMAAAITHGDVIVNGYVENHLNIFTNKLRDANVQFQLLPNNKIHVSKSTIIKPVDIRTDIYPGFPTDLQAPFAVLMTQANGNSRVFETMYDGRLNYLKELAKMGSAATILDPHRAIIMGPSVLYGREIDSLDIRAGATLILAALTANGQSTINHAEIIDRGYEQIDDKLRKLGAHISRTND